MALRILVIEDNQDNFDLMRYLLAAAGHQVIEARDGVTGLARAVADRPDLIVCDIQLPGLDGYEIARRLRGDADLDLIPLVAVTALAMVGDREKALASGFDGYIAKPIEPETFARHVESCVPPRQPPPPARA
jgi:CheY-like chemotaxis protein